MGNQPLMIRVLIPILGSMNLLTSEEKISSNFLHFLATQLFEHDR